MTTTSSTLAAIMATNGRHGLGAKVAVCAAALGCAATLIFSAQQLAGGVQQQFPATNVQTGDDTIQAPVPFGSRFCSLKALAQVSLCRC